MSFDLELTRIPAVLSDSSVERCRQCLSSLCNLYLIHKQSRYSKKNTCASLCVMQIPGLKRCEKRKREREREREGGGGDISPDINQWHSICITNRSKLFFMLPHLSHLIVLFCFFLYFYPLQIYGVLPLGRFPLTLVC